VISDQGDCGDLLDSRFRRVYGWRPPLTPAGGSDADLLAVVLLVFLGVVESDPIRLPGQFFAELQDGGYWLLIRYFIEKDFPCIHPRAADALEGPSETFAPPPGFVSKEHR